MATWRRALRQLSPLQVLAVARGRGRRRKRARRSGEGGISGEVVGDRWG
jgi:hypothetical protein